jgi:hypothetical protein
LSITRSDLETVRGTTDSEVSLAGTPETNKGRDFMKKSFSLMAIAAAVTAIGLVALLAVPVAANGHSKATGTIHLEPSAFGDRNISFDAHDDAPAAQGATEDRGSITQSVSGANNGQYTARLDCVVVDGNMAYFSGIVESATGFYEQFLGDRVYAAVVDGGTPGRNGDMWQATFTAGGDPCGGATSAAGLANGEVVDGNLSVKDVD